MLKRIFLSAAISPDDIDDSKYTLQKKLSEVCLFGLAKRLLLTIQAFVGTGRCYRTEPSIIRTRYSSHVLLRPPHHSFLQRELAGIDPSLT